MKLKKWIPALLAVVLGGIAAKIARDTLLKNKHAEPTAVKVIQVAVASSDMVAGHDLRVTDVTLMAISTPTAPPDTFANPMDVVGRVLVSPILKGQTINGSCLAGKGVPPTLAALIPAGMRALTMNIDDMNSQSGMLTPGAHVDVVSSIPSGTGAEKEYVTHTLLKDVLIQAVGQRVVPKVEDGKDAIAPYHTITVIVTPHDAKLLEMAQMKARVRLLMRGINRGDGKEEDVDYITVGDVEGEGSKFVDFAKAHGPTTMPSDPRLVAKVVEIKPKWTVELIKGGTVQKLEFDIPKPESHVETDLTTPAIPGADEQPQD